MRHIATLPIEGSKFRNIFDFVTEGVKQLIMGCISICKQHPRIVGVLVLLIAFLIFTWIPSTPDVIMTLNSNDDIIKIRDFVEREYCSLNLYENIDTRIFSDKILPLIGSRGYLQDLENYVCTYPSLNVLVVWGPKSVGKTFGINIMSDLWKKQRRIVIDIDLKGFDGEFEDFIELTRNAIRTSTSSYKLNKFSLRKLNSNIKKTDNKLVESWFYSILGWLGYSILEPILKGLGYILPITKHWYEVSISNSIKAIDEWSSSFIGNTQHRFEQAKFSTLLLSLEMFGSQYPSIAPIVIIKEFQILENLPGVDGEKGKKFISELFSYFEARKQRRNIVPVILETSDYLWVKKNNLLKSPGSFRSLLIKELEREEVWNSLEKLNVWSKEELEILWKAVGGHGGSINDIFSYRVSNPGKPIDYYISQNQEMIINMLISAIIDKSGLNNTEFENTIKKRKEFLKKFKREGYETYVEDPESDPVVSHFFRRNILFVSESRKVTPQNLGLQHAIDKYIEIFCKEEK